MLLPSAPGATTSIQWDLWLFWPAFGWAFAVVVAGVFWANGRDKISWSEIVGPQDHLVTGWSFSQSWVANLTAAATLVAGLFASSSILQGVLGSGSGQALTVMLISGALATAAAGAGTILTATFKAAKGVFGFAVIIGAVITLGATGGQLMVIGDQASGLSLGPLDNFVWPLVAVSGLLLSLYGVAVIRSTLVGTKPAVKAAQEQVATDTVPPAPPSPAVWEWQAFGRDAAGVQPFFLYSAQPEDAVQGAGAGQQILMVPTGGTRTAAVL